MLIVASVYLPHGRRYWFTAVAGALMLVTTMGALACQTYQVLTTDKPESPLAVVSFILVVVGLVVLVQTIGAFRRGAASLRRAGLRG